MIKPTFNCDGCGLRFEGMPPATLVGDFSHGRGGILLPRKDWHFCDHHCLTDWLKRATFNTPRPQYNETH